uniref:FYVE, RhoGEF and PH domain containing 3 n=1 Tax=Myotis myotis TaxID=51298 RepID=A0A7J7RCY5_MYOMY|nr:FYVE, RhoGEF and PH domain containing 3 [Myotis myotis]
MEAGGGVSTAPAPRAAPEGPEDGPGGCSPELPGTDPGKLQALPIGPGAPRAAPAPRSPGGQAAVSPAKIPNRDSGIDSPTRSAPAGPFSCQEGSEAGGPTLPALHPEAAPGSNTTRKEANSDMGQDGGQEPALESSPPGACADLAKRSRSQELLHIAQELLHTEETYVRRLHLLDQVAFWLGHAFVCVHSFMGSFTGKLPILTLARPYIWNTNDYTKTQTNLSTLQKLILFAFRACGCGAKVLPGPLAGFYSLFLAVTLYEHVNSLWTSF